MIRNLPWVQDGIAREGWEDDTVSALVEIARRLPMTFQALIGRTWIQDGPTSEEWSMLTAFAGVPLDNNVEAALLVGMPFLDAVDRADARLIRALLGTASHLARRRWGHHRPAGSGERYHRHPAFNGCALGARPVRPGGRRAVQRAALDRGRPPAWRGSSILDALGQCPA